MTINYKIYIDERFKRLSIEFDNLDLGILSHFLISECDFHKCKWLLKYTKEVLNGLKERYCYDYNDIYIYIDNQITNLQYSFDDNTDSKLTTKEFYQILLDWYDNFDKFINENPFNMDMKSLRLIDELDREDFIMFADKFYHSNAVDHTVPMSYHENTFDVMMKSNTYATAYMIEFNGKSIGYVLFSKTYSNEANGIVLWLEELFILDKYRGKGLGKYVLSYLNNIYMYDDFFNHIKRVRLEITPNNNKAKKLYQSMGFEVLNYHQMFKDI